jgi:predicted aspartyl protease
MHLYSTALAAELGISLTVTSRVVLADHRTVEVLVGVAFLRIGDREGGIIVALMDTPMPLIGATVLEIRGLKVNPVEETLEHARPFGATALQSI